MTHIVEVFKHLLNTNLIDCTTFYSDSVYEHPDKTVSEQSILSNPCELLYLLLPGDLDLSFERPAPAHHHEEADGGWRRSGRAGSLCQETLQLQKRWRRSTEVSNSKTFDPQQQHPTTLCLQYANRIISERDSLFCPVSSLSESSRHQQAF